MGVPNWQKVLPGLARDAGDGDPDLPLDQKIIFCRFVSLWPGAILLPEPIKVLALPYCESLADPSSKRNGVRLRSGRWEKGNRRFVLGQKKWAGGWNLQPKSERGEAYDLRNCAEIRVTLSPAGTGTVHVGES